MKTLTLLFCSIFTLFTHLNVCAQDNDIAYTRAWGTFFGDAAMGLGVYPEIHMYKSAIDFEGNLWMVGSVSLNAAQNYFDSLITVDAYQSVYGGGESDGIIVRFSAEGNLSYASYIGGDGKEEFLSLDVNGDKVVVVGQTTSETNISTIGTYQEELYENVYANGMTFQKAGFIALFDTTGQKNWGTYYQGNQTSLVSQVAISDQGDLFIWGMTRSTNMATPETFKDSIPPLSNTPPGETPHLYPILARFSFSGELIWATYYAPDYVANNGSQISSPAGLAVDNLNNVYVNGTTNDDQGFYGTTDAHQTSNNGSHDAFVAKFDNNGNRIWGTYYGGAGGEICTNIHVPNKNNLYISGVTLSQSGIATEGTFQNSYQSGGYNSFVAKINYLNGQRIWGSYFSRVSTVGTASIDEDQQGNVYIYQPVNQSDNITYPNSFQEMNQGGASDMIMAKLNGDGDEIIWGSYYGGSGDEVIPIDQNAIIISDLNHIYISGRTSSPSSNYMISQNPFQSQGSHFLAKFVPCPTISAPSFNISQEYLPNMTLEDLEVEFIDWTGSPLITTWYADTSTWEEIPTSTPVEFNQTYFVTQQIQGCSESEATSILFSDLSVEENSLTHLVVFPNPTDSWIYLEVPKNVNLKKVQVFDIKGKLIHHQSSAEKIYLGNASQGVYFLHLEAQNGDKVVRLIVKQ